MWSAWLIDLVTVWLAWLIICITVQCGWPDCLQYLCCSVVGLIDWFSYSAAGLIDYLYYCTVRLAWLPICVTIIRILWLQVWLKIQCTIQTVESVFLCLFRFAWMLFRYFISSPVHVYSIQYIPRVPNQLHPGSNWLYRQQSNLSRQESLTLKDSVGRQTNMNSLDEAACR